MERDLKKLHSSTFFNIASPATPWSYISLQGGLYSSAVVNCVAKNTRWTAHRCNGHQFRPNCRFTFTRQKQKELSLRIHNTRYELYKGEISGKSPNPHLFWFLDGNNESTFVMCGILLTHTLTPQIYRREMSNIGIESWRRPAIRSPTPRLSGLSRWQTDHVPVGLFD